MHRSLTFLSFLLLLTTWPAFESSAQPIVPVGNQFQVNSITTGVQNQPRIVYDGIGGFVVVWRSDGAEDGSGGAVLARRLDGSGAPSGSEFVVNSYTTGSQRNPELSADGSGGFAVVFENANGSLTDPSQPVHFRAFDAANQPLADDLQVNTTTTGDQSEPSVVTTAAGEFLVAFRDDSLGLADETIRLRWIDSAGVGVGSDFVISELLAENSYEVQISSDGGGDFVVVWTSPTSNGTDSDDQSVQARRVDATGLPIGSQFQVNSYTSGFQYQPAVSADGDGGFLVSWLTDPFDGGVTDYDVAARRFFADGTPRGVDFKVSTSTAMGSFRDAPRTTGDSEGGSVVVWQEDSVSDIVARRVDSTGTPMGEALQVNTYTTGDQDDPSIAATPTGEFVVVWRSFGSYGSDTDSTSIQARRFAFDHDEDGIGNPVDNCPDDPNPSQTDGDGDGSGDPCDLCAGDDAGGDMDGDGLCAGSVFECDDDDATNACAAVFADGFESGDTSAWSATVG